MPSSNSASSPPSTPSSPTPKFVESALISVGRRYRTRPLPRLTRQRRLRYISLDFDAGDSDPGVVESSPAGDSGGIGDGVFSSSFDAGFGGGALRLPHRLPLPSRLGKDLDGEEGNGVGSKLAYQPAQRSTKHSGISSDVSTFRQLRKVLLNSNSPKTMNCTTKSAPVSGLSSPVHSPARSPRRFSTVEFSYTDATNRLKDWSASETYPCDLGAALPPGTAAQKLVDSIDPSGFHNIASSNPVLRSRNNSTPGSPKHHSTDPSGFHSIASSSPVTRSRNASTPGSPRHLKSFDNFTLRFENGSSVHVHPLPLPPVAPAALRSVPKAEMLPVANQWKKGKLIGSGSFGNVYEGTNRNTGALCAIKEVTIIPDDPNSLECIKQLEKEIKFLSQFKHPNIVQYYGSETIDDRFYIYLEYVHPGSINKYVHERFGAMTELVVRNFTRHILRGLAYLHGKKIVHRDIKGANLLVDNRGVVKLADFGMAKHLSEAASALSLKGSPYWMAPEVMQATMNNKYSGYDLSVDIWSLGCTIIEMFTGKHPWSGLEGAAAMFEVLHKDPPIPDTLSGEGKDFLQCCFRRNPADRPTANMLLKHSFVRHSYHCKIHGSLQAFTGMKLIDNLVSRKDRKSINESYVRERQTSDSEEYHPHPGTSNSTGFCAIRHSFPENYLLPSQSQAVIKITARDLQAYALPLPYIKKTVKIA